VANADSEREEEYPLFEYSLNPSIALDVLIAVMLFIFAIYSLIVEHVISAAFVVAGLFAADFYYRLWRRPVRKALFYDDHFEISGQGVNLRTGYDRLEDLQKVRRLLGDFRSDSAIWFSVKNDPNDFMIPNRKVGKPKVELYSWLMQKNPKASVQA
jgi:hypothetical protein